MKAKAITTQFFDDLLKNTTLLTDGPHGPKMLKTADNLFIRILPNKHHKLFAKKRSNANRFIRNITKLKQRGINTVKLDNFYYFPEKDWHIITYHGVPGQTLEEYASSHQNIDLVIENLAAFLVELHSKQIYFRGGHCGNILIQDENTFALIDISNARFWLINMRRRARSVYYILTHNAPKCLQNFGMKRFKEAYIKAARFSSKEKLAFEKALTKHNF